MASRGLARSLAVGALAAALLAVAAGSSGGDAALSSPGAARAPSPGPSPALRASPTPFGTPFGTPGATADPAATPTPPATPAPRPTARPDRSTRSPTCGRSGARVVRFRVLVERGLATTPQRFLSDLLSVLCDERSWIGSGTVRFRHDPGARLLISLRTAASTERRCLALVGLSVRRFYSCASSSEAVLNADRWFGGSKYWPGSVPDYRRMLVNHEVGHVLGQRHRSCSKAGAPAPVMMQQSKGLHGCKPNPWPLPRELGRL